MESWRHQIPVLAEAGYRVIALDQRGYNLSAKPKGARAYSTSQLALDVVALADCLGIEKLRLVGHDWGAAVAWSVATNYPERLHKLVILNVPYPSVLTRHLHKDIRQLFKSWYIFFFQIAWLPEFLLGLGSGNGLARLLRESGHKTTFSDEDIAQYRQAWGQPGALSGMLNWYRAVFRDRGPRALKAKIQVPTLIIWGEQDVALQVQMASESLEYCADGRLELIPEAAHWLAV
jgi:pimeloyl-ACP methyl ester carboxylesterase